MPKEISVRVRWSRLHDDHDGWGAVRCLYAYQSPRGREILYIGKSWGVTVRGRWRYEAKKDFWDALKMERGISSHIPLFGELELPKGRLLTHKLLADVESLLIYSIEPWGNLQSVNSRRPRPGLIVRCLGDWPHRALVFEDED